MPNFTTARPRNSFSNQQKILAIVFQLVALSAITLCLCKLALADGAVIWGFEPPEMAAARRSPADVIGDLGGMPVKISRNVAEYVEYDGDPGFSGPPRHGPPPQRTYASRLKSFGFDVRFPDMAMLTTREMVVDKANHNIYNTPWMGIGISSGEIYPGRGFMNRLTAIEKIENRYWWNDYEELPKKYFGLTEYRLKGTNPNTGRPAREDRDAEVIYLFFDDMKNIITRIDCSNVPHEAAPCRQRWDIGNHGLSVKVSAGYRRGFLQDWALIQEKVTQVILNFRADPCAVPETPNPSAETLSAPRP
jgi:hypothetical protein